MVRGVPGVMVACCGLFFSVKTKYSPDFDTISFCATDSTVFHCTFILVYIRNVREPKQY